MRVRAPTRLTCHLPRSRATGLAAETVRARVFSPTIPRAAEGLEASPETVAAYEEQLERGRDQQGEGRI